MYFVLCFGLQISLMQLLAQKPYVFFFYSNIYNLCFGLIRWWFSSALFADTIFIQPSRMFRYHIGFVGLFFCLCLVNVSKQHFCLRGVRVCHYPPHRCLSYIYIYKTELVARVLSVQTQETVFPHMALTGRPGCCHIRRHIRIHHCQILCTPQA